MFGKIIIVGNGPSVLDNSLGNIIDSYDAVVRFNDYKLIGFEKHVGTKTDIWFNTLTISPPRPCAKKIIWHSWHWDPKTDVRFIKFKETVDKTVTLDKTKIETIKEMQKYVGDNQYFNYSTGTIAIWMMLKEVDIVTITGFDWWIPGKKHHYHNNATIGNIHKTDKELVFIEKLKKENRIIII